MQVEHKTEKGTVRFELLPEEVSKVKLYNYSRAGIWYGDAEPKGLNAWKKQLPKGFQLIGLTSELTEDQAKIMVDREKPSYGTNSEFTEQWASDSFKSLMQHLQVYEVNPFEKPNINDFKSFPFCPTGDCKAYHDLLNEYKQANERTGKWVVLFKPKEK